MLQISLEIGCVENETPVPLAGVWCGGFENHSPAELRRQANNLADRLMDAAVIDGIKR